MTSIYDKRYSVFLSKDLTEPIYQVTNPNIKDIEYLLTNKNSCEKMEDLDTIYLQEINGNIFLTWVNSLDKYYPINSIDLKDYITFHKIFKTTLKDFVIQQDIQPRIYL